MIEAVRQPLWLPPHLRAARRVCPVVCATPFARLFKLISQGGLVNGGVVNAGHAMVNAGAIRAHKTATGPPFTDSFDRADSLTTLGFTDTGQQWLYPNGTWGISSNAAYSVASVVGALAVFETGLTNIDLTTPVTLSGGNSGIVVRNDTSNNWYMFIATSIAWELWSVVAASGTKIASGSVTVGTPIRLLVYNTQIYLIANNVLLTRFDDSTVTSGTRVGLYASSNTTFRWNSLTAAAVTAVTDHFTRADAGTLGAPWTTDSGTFSIVSNQAKKTASANTHQYATLDIGGADMDVQAVAVNASSVAFQSITARYIDDTHNWTFQFGTGAGTNTQLIKWDPGLGGGFTVVLSNLGTVSSGDTVRVTCIGDEWTVYINGTLKGSATDSLHNTATKCGLEAYTVNAIWDDFVAVKI